jgi:hypothetical protein
MVSAWARPKPRRWRRLQSGEALRQYRRDTGYQLKLVPSGDKLEVRARPQCHARLLEGAGLSAQAFDSEGFC